MRVEVKAQGRPLGRTKGSFLAGVLFFLCVIFGCYQLTLNVKQILAKANYLALTELRVAGAEHYIDRQEVLQAVRKQLAPMLVPTTPDPAMPAQIPPLLNVVQVDAPKIQAALLQLPWVQQAAVRKRWPNTLQVALTEQTVAARWNKTEFLNDQGERFAAPDRVQTPLLLLSGPNDQASTVLRASLRYQTQLVAHGYPLQRVHLTPRHAWELTLESGITLYLGRNDVVLRLQRFIDAFPEIEPHEQVAYVDLRYDTGIAVGWKANK
ncbi:MAG: cell division protein FtsQ/DivIB [Aeromonas sp.]